MILLCVILTTTFVMLLLYHDYKKRNVCSMLACPKTVPFLGNAHQLIGNSADFFASMNNCWHECGTRARCFIGQRIVLLLSEPKDVEVVMSRQEFICKSKEYDFLKPWLGQGLLTSTGDRWRIHRKIITPAFHFKILENFTSVFTSQTDILVNKLDLYVGKGPVDVYPIVAMYALDTISETAMGVSVNAQKYNDSEYVTAVKEMCEVICGRNKNPFKRLDWIFRLTNDNKKQKKALSILHSFTNKMIQERKRFLMEKNETMTSYTNDETDIYGMKKKMAFLDLLLLSRINGEPLSDTSIREEVDTFLFEGHDTTTSAISFALHLLAQNQDVQEKLYEEQMRIFADDINGDCTISKLHDMKYMELVIRETIRLYPSVPMLARETLSDTYINDIPVPEGASIVILIYNMNRNPAVFPEPEKFIPERFACEESNKRHPFSTVSFSAGPRNCIGQKFAMMEMKCALSKIVRTFKLLPSEIPLELKCDIILKSVNGIFVQLKRRSDIFCDDTPSCLM